jgi:hypothetical protein
MDPKCERHMSMKEVKIVLVHDAYTDYDDSKAIMQQGVSDWETISDEDYQLLQQNWWKLCQDLNVNNARLVLLEKDSVPVKMRLESIRAWIAQEKAKAEREAQIKRDKAQARALKKLAADAASEKRLLEELKKKYPDA